jgi:hypothetical protein
MAADARDRFASRFAALLEDSGLQANQAAARVNASRPQGASWSVTAGVLSAWKTGRNLPSEPKQVGFFRVVRFLTEHARGRAARGHTVGQLLDEVGWTRLLDQARAAPLPDALHLGEIALYLRALIEWLNIDPWPRWFAGPALAPAAIERKLRIANGCDGEQELDADELAGQCARLVVLGGPGSGKTWLARRTARLCAEAALEALAEGALPDEVEVPLYTTCARLFAASPGDGIRRAIVSSALGQLPDLGGSRVTDALQALFEERNTPTLLVADSLDEASGADDRIRQADTLPPSWRIVLTSRQAAWNHQLAIRDADPSRRTGVLQPLCYPSDVEAFIAAWFSVRPSQAAVLAAQLRGRPAVQQAATVPLILAFYCIVGGDQSLPARRTDLFTKVIRRMLTGQWRGSGERDPDPDACLETLRDWAWSSAASDPVSGVGAWADEFATPRVRHSQDDRAALGHVAPPLGPPDADTGLTRRSFVHRSLCEHLVAEHVALRMSAEEAADELLNHLWYDPDWEYVAPAALAMHPQRDRVLESLVRRATNSDHTRADLMGIDGCGEIRKFLARVARESAADDWPPGASEMIAQARHNFALSGRGSDNLRLVASASWPESNSLILRSMLGFASHEASTWVAWALADAVEWLALTAEDGVQVREALLGLLPDQTDSLTCELLADAAAALALTDQDRSQVRELLLRLIFDGTNPEVAAALASAVARLDPTAEDQASARQVLLRLLPGQAIPWIARQLADAIVQLVVTDADRADARQALLGLLPEQADPQIAEALAVAAAALALTDNDRAHVRQILLGLVPGQASRWSALRVADAVAGLNPTAEDRAQLRDALLGLLPARTDPHFPAQDLQTEQDLVYTVARLAVTDEDRIQVRETLLGLLPDQGIPWIATAMAKTAVNLAVTDEDREQVRESLLGLLYDEPDPWVARGLAAAVAQLDPSAQDRARVRQALLRLIPEQTDFVIAGDLAAAVAQLDPSAQDRARVRQVLLRLLSGQRHPEETGQDLVQAILRLTVTDEDRVQVREALLRLIPDQVTSWNGWLLVDAVTRLAATDEDRVQVRGALLGLLPDQAHPEIAKSLADAAVALAVTDEDRVQVREVLLGLLPDQINPVVAAALASAVARLDPTAEDQASARQVLLRLLPDQGHPQEARTLANAVAQLGPTVADLGGSDRWPHPPHAALLAAVRQNSGLSAWLAALPLLSGRTPITD